MVKNHGIMKKSMKKRNKNFSRMKKKEDKNKLNKETSVRKKDAFFKFCVQSGFKSVFV